MSLLTNRAADNAKHAQAIENLNSHNEQLREELRIKDRLVKKLLDKADDELYQNTAPVDGRTPSPGK